MVGVRFFIHLLNFRSISPILDKGILFEKTAEYLINS